jgi:hypothetical protein
MRRLQESPNCDEDNKPVISDERVQQLKGLFVADGIELSDATALEIGAWLLARAASISPAIPVTEKELFRTIKASPLGKTPPSRKT